MAKSFQENIDSTANDLRTQYRDINIDTFLTFFDTSEALERYYEKELEVKSVSHAGFTFLNVLILYGGRMLQTDIGNKISRSRHAISRVISTLQKHGFVIAGPVGGDRRKREVSITARGLAVAKRYNIYERERVAKAVLAVLSKAEIENLDKTLKKLNKHVRTLIQE